ncbi:hypothetical protein [Sphingobacterium siyangense]|uniref:hypothetical protein n=1 Tax=Sphingobacterium siyangense TaxID=459529 RepID=UPI003DA5AD4F
MDSTRKVTIITGAYPPKVCGVGDYTAKLIAELRKLSSFEIDLFYKDTWSLKYLINYIRELLSRKSNFYHLQYPTEGYGYSVLPLLLLLLLPYHKRIVTIHEFSSRNLSAYIYTGFLVFFSAKTIVTNALEYKHACRFTLNKKKVHVIPIASNISASANANRKFSDREIDLAYFGHIRPIKGLEDFIYTRGLIKQRINCKIIGQSLDNYRDFFNTIQNRATEYQIEMVANRSQDVVEGLLANTKILYLPYPDGISNRRGTLLAGIQNGCVIVSRYSQHKDFNNFFKDHCHLVKNNDEAAITIENILFGKSEHKSTEALRVIFSWKNVVAKHQSLYQ